MSFQTAVIVHVYYIRGTEKLAMGRLALKNARNSSEPLFLMYWHITAMIMRKIFPLS